jgi:hypothetical protein
VMSATISALFVGVLASYICYLCFLRIVVSNTYCFGDLFCSVCLRLVSCVLNVASFSGVCILDCPFDFLYHLFTMKAR